MTTLRLHNLKTQWVQELSSFITDREQVLAELRLILEHCTPYKQSVWMQNPSLTLTTEEQKAVQALIDQRQTTRAPIQYLIGNAYFYELDFVVTPDVLIPRPETELLVQLAIDTLQAKAFNNPAQSLSVLDLCTGSGCIILSIAHSLRQKGFHHIRYSASDWSTAALNIAQQNGARHDLNSVIQWHHSDWFATIPPQQFDLIVSNPPYIAELYWKSLSPEVKDHEPKLALISAENGLSSYRQIAEEAIPYLTPNGQILLEIDEQQAEDIISILKAQEAWTKVTAHKDFNHKDRILQFQRTPD